MLASFGKSPAAVFVGPFLLAFGLIAAAQTSNSTAVIGTVSDPSGAVVPGATVRIQNPVSHFDRTATSDSSGKFSIPNVPFNNYHLTANASGFGPYVQDIDVRSTVPVNIPIHLALEAATTKVTVEASAEDLLEKTPTFHTDVDRGLFQRLPLESQSSSVSSLVTLATPGIAADSNGLFHGMGDHASNSFSIDGQPVTDQVSKVFSNQLPVDSIESLEVIAGAPPAEYGGKTSVVVNVATRSGLGLTTPQGSITASYGSFGTSTADFNLGYGGAKWGNFLSVSGLNTGRFLDPPEFTVMHAKGNEENIFDRVDYQFSNVDSLHLNLGFTRSWFQTPNSFDLQNHNCSSPYLAGISSPLLGFCINGSLIDPLTGSPLGPSDQRSQIRTYNIAPTWTRTLSNTAVFTLGAYVRHDEYNYYPSANQLYDFIPNLLDTPGIGQQQSVGQYRTLTNAGALSNVSYVKGIHNLKAGAVYEQTFLYEDDNIGIIDPTFLGTLTTPSGVSCLSANGTPIAEPCITLSHFDLTRGGIPYHIPLPSADIKELSMYVQDSITKGSWNFNLGIRGDIYNGITSAQAAEPRVGAAYNIKRTNTILRLSYARTLETPFNENLILSSLGCGNPILNPVPGVVTDSLLSCAAAGLTPIRPGRRNEYHAGLQQAFGKYVVFSGEYVWKYTNNAYDFSVLGSTPITFPIEWRKSKIPGVAGRVSMANFHGLTAFTVFSSVAARFFQPQLGGAGATPSVTIPVFRIDHDEKFNQTTHVQYQPWKNGPWFGFNWRYDSGLVAGPVPCAGGQNCANSMPGENTVVNVASLTPNQQFQAGLFCGPVRATPTTSISLNGLCPASLYGSPLVSIPAPGTENDDHNPPRIAPRNLFDLSVGDDNLFKSDRYKWSLQFTVINMTNSYSLYNFLSTFSGTHYVTPRTYTAQLGFHF
jgi:hypothetical protein